jgi:REP element-mobilizing transposase RayT
MERKRARLEMYVHLVWATYRRLPLIVPDRERQVHHLVEFEAKERGCDVLAIGGLDDHIHILLKLPSVVSVAQLVKQMKGVSSRRLTSEWEGEVFKWQDGYSATTLHKSLLPCVKNYVSLQRERHKRNEIWPELESF